MSSENVRNFCIIAHIDHGKSTLADRILEATGALTPGEGLPQYLDRMDLERERGITIKAQAVRLSYQYGGEQYRMNLIDTPGHVDFTYEVSRTLAACEGAVLLVDAAQGVEAQTVANLYLAEDNGLEIIPVVNKIDLPSAEPERVAGELVEILGVERERIIFISAKTGEGVDSVMNAVVERVPPPVGSSRDKLQALIFDSTYDPYRGVVVFVRLFAGIMTGGSKITMMATGVRSQVEELGIFNPDMDSRERLEAGDVGYVMTGIKDVSQCKVGDTITYTDGGVEEPLPGYREPKPMVFAGLYPVDSGEFESLRDALGRLRLNDASFVFEPETSMALGFGFRCGFLGMLHLDIIKERLEREFGLDIVVTAPNVEYIVLTKEGELLEINNPSEMPPSNMVEEVEEPYVTAYILTPSEAVGPVMELCQERRGEYREMKYLSTQRVEITYRLPLAEMVSGFYDKLKGGTRGYGSLDYEHAGYRPGPLVKLEILLEGEPVDAFSTVVDSESAYRLGRQLVARLRKMIPRQMFSVSIQAAVGGRIIARETVAPRRKDVTAKCYGGDVTRKRKLLEKQKAGKKRMKKVGRVELPTEAFISFLSTEEEGNR